MTSSKLEALKNKYKFNPDAVSEKAKAEVKEEDPKKGYKLPNGLNKWRTVAFDDGEVIKIAWVHMNLGEPFLCPKKLDWNAECPDCAFGWDLWTANGKKHTDESKNFLAQEKYIIQGFARAEEKNDIEKFGYPRLRFLDLSPTSGKKVVTFLTKEAIEEFGDITDFDAGRDLNIMKDAEKAAARQNSVDIQRAGKESALLATVKPSDPKFEEYVTKAFENSIPFNERFAVKSKLEILQMMDALKKRLATKADKNAPKSFADEIAHDFEDAVSSLKESNADDLEDLTKLF